MVLKLCSVRPPVSPPSQPPSPSVLLTRLGTYRRESFAGIECRDVYFPKTPRIVLGSLPLANEVPEYISGFSRLCRQPCRSFDPMALYFLRKNRELPEIGKILDDLNKHYPESLIFCGFGGRQTPEDLVGHGPLPPYAIFADTRSLYPTFYELSELRGATLALFCTRKSEIYLVPSPIYPPRM